MIEIELNEIWQIENFEKLNKYIENKYKVSDFKQEICFKNIILFGAGYLGRKILKSLRAKGINPQYFCDNDKNKWGQCIDGLYVLPPNFIKGDIINTLVIISLTSISKPVVDQLEEMNVKYLFADSDGTVGILPSPNLYTNITELIKVNDLFIDDFSKKVYLNIVKSKIFQNLSFELSGSLFTHSIVTGPQYFDTEFFKYSDGELYIDCGAYDGDSIIEFYAMLNGMNLKNCEVYAFEPDKTNYEKVLKTINQYNLEKAKVFNMGTGNNNYKSNMKQIENCRHINENYDIEIVKLDDILKDKKVTFIKMDIEGFELDALKGAVNLIEKYKPKLAISIYHNSSDLYEIPLFIKSIVPEYRLFVRHHSYNTYLETICYAFVNEE